MLIRKLDVNPQLFACSRSLTAWGFALPPVDFITWPTNQPSMVGLALTCSTLSGLAAMISSTAFSMAPVSVTCFRPRASTISAGEPPSVQTISKTSLAILPEIVPLRDQIDDLAQLDGGNRCGFNDLFLPCSSGRRAR